MGLKKQMFDEPFCWCIQYCFSSKLSRRINERGGAFEIMIIQNKMKYHGNTMEMQWKYKGNLKEIQLEFKYKSNIVSPRN